MVMPDRALRRMVAKLSALPSEDCEAILDRLDDRHRSRVTELLAHLDGRPPPSSTAPALPRFDAKAMPAGLSSWLLDRLGVPVEGGITLPNAGKMTEHAATVLKACAAELDPAPPEPEQRPSLVGRLRRRLGRASA